VCAYTGLTRVEKFFASCTRPVKRSQDAGFLPTLCIDALLSREETNHKLLLLRRKLSFVFLLNIAPKRIRVNNFLVRLTLAHTE
jgi:hypothetical protein